jgi:TnpA family transposase
VIRHCTEMEVDRQYVDSHGQSTVAFAFCRLLGFQLMPRLKAIHVQKLYRPEAGQPDAYTHLQLVLTKPIDWELIRQQYDQMIKYTTALRLGTAETEAIHTVAPNQFGISSLPYFISPFAKRPLLGKRQRLLANFTLSFRRV